MSSTASFYMLPVARLPELDQNAEIIIKKSFFSKKVTDNYWDFLSANATELSGPETSGSIYANLLIFLKEEKGIDLMTNEYDDLANALTKKRGSSHFLFTYSQKKTLSAQLDPGNFSLYDIRNFNEEFSGEVDEETAIATLDALKVLIENLERLNTSETVLLLIVG